MYKVKEIFYSIQGEGYHVGTPALFLRFSGCNMWSGREEDRATGKGPCAQWCDTDFVGGETYELADDVVKACIRAMPYRIENTIVVITGGEPLLQLDVPLLRALRAHSFIVHVETNGTVVPKWRGIRGLPRPWVTLSPKIDDAVVLEPAEISELKLVIDPRSHEDMQRVAVWEFFFAGGRKPKMFLQAIDRNGAADTNAIVEMCKRNPLWRLSVQMHKLIGIE